MDTILGQIQLFPYNFGMEYWAKCDGSLLQISQNQALYSLLGANYGGDGRVTFAVPNLIGAEPLPGMCYYIALQGDYPRRS